MSGRDLEADDFPHGTVDGWERGCRGRWCPSETISCLTARTRFVDDWGYRKSVLAERAARAAEARKRRVLTADDEQVIRAMALEGKNNGDIGRRLGFTPHVIGTRRRAMGLPSASRGRSRKETA